MPAKTRARQPNRPPASGGAMGRPPASVRAMSRRGANAIEFALTLPLFLTVLFAMIEYGYLFAMQAGIDNAIATACRSGAMIDPNAGSPTAVAEATFTSRGAMFCDGGGACSFIAEDLSTGEYAAPNRTLRCSATRTMSELTGFLPEAIYPPTISSASYYRLEWQRK
jgi:TadE-like protein